ncbi:hypothetical protein [Pedobacter sp.]|uniref:hypothetical protein n=1 Tax=Pedobacter sp. TaxID=1411316 RepID=UPI003D7FB420
MKAKIIIVACIALFIFNLVALIQSNFVWKGHFHHYAGLLSSALLVVSQIIGIKHRQKIKQSN